MGLPPAIDRDGLMTGEEILVVDPHELSAEIGESCPGESFSFGFEEEGVVD